MSKLSNIEWGTLPGRFYRSVRGIAPTIGFGLLVYAVALVVIFPYERVGDFAEAVAAGAGYDLDVGGVSPTLGVGVTMVDMKVATRPVDGSKPSRFLIDRATVTTSPWRNLTGGMAYNLSTEMFGGEVEADVDADAEMGQGTLNINSIQIGDLPGVAAAVGLPVKGKLSLDADLSLPELEIRKAQGEISLSCSGCEVGDNKAKIKVPNNPLMADGLTIPRLRLGKLEGDIIFEDGVGRIDGMRSKSTDGEIIIDGEVRLSEPFNMSRIDLYIRFKVSDKLLKSSDKIQLLLQFAEADGKRPDGFYGMRLRGSLRKMGQPQWLKEQPKPAPRRQRTPKRPRAATRPKVEKT